jgi:hypothetical protein
MRAGAPLRMTTIKGGQRILVANSKIERGLCIEKLKITLSFTIRHQCVMRLQHTTAQEIVFALPLISGEYQYEDEPEYIALF